MAHTVSGAINVHASTVVSTALKGAYVGGIQTTIDLDYACDHALAFTVYTDDTEWRNRAEFPRGREQVRAFLQRKWARELDYRLIKELWAFGGDRIAVRFAYEWHDDSGHWYRSYGNENWEFNDHGLMQRRFASINDLPIKAEDRLFHWPLGRRPDVHAGLSELGL